MVNTTIKIMGVEAQYAIPANLAEAIALPGASEELVYKAFLKQVLYHCSYGAIRAKVSDLLEARGHGTRKSFHGKKEVTQVETEVEGKKVKVWQFDNGKALTETQAEDVVTETDMQFFGRVCAEKGVEATEFAELIQTAANDCPFDVTRKERTAGEKKAGKIALKIATEIADNGGLERVAQQLSMELGEEIDVTGDREAAINALALAIAKNEKREAEARRNKYLGK